MNTSNLIKEIKVLQKAAKIHAKYSITQYKKVLNYLEKLEKQKKSLEKEVKIRTIHLQKEIEKKETLTKVLENLAKYDQLTSLANRYKFLSELELLTKKHKNFSILFIDLDGFKLINDTYGHEVGDMLLQTVAERIRKSVRHSDIVARLGGDEFTVILKNVKDKKILSNIAQKIINNVKKPIVIDEMEMSVGASIGIYSSSADDSHEDILSKADIAMYEAKKQGKGKYIFFEEFMKSRDNVNEEIKIKVKSALNENKLSHLYFPIVDGEKIVGSEILLRFKDNIEIEATHFFKIVENDVKTLKNVTFAQINEVQNMLKKSNIFYSINLSYKMLNKDFLYYLTKLKNRERIFFEIDEEALTKGLTIEKFLKDIKDLGYNLTFDNFTKEGGEVLKILEFPFSCLKIDKSLTLSNEIKKKKLLEALVKLGLNLDLNVIIEGVENISYIQHIPPHKNLYYEGYHFFKPMSAKKLLKLV